MPATRQEILPILEDASSRLEQILLDMNTYDVEEKNSQA